MNHESAQRATELTDQQTEIRRLRHELKRITDGRDF